MTRRTTEPRAYEGDGHDEETSGSSSETRDEASQAGVGDNRQVGRVGEDGGLDGREGAKL